MRLFTSLCGDPVSQFVRMSNQNKKLLNVRLQLTPIKASYNNND